MELPCGSREVLGKNNLAITSHQFSWYLAVIYHQRNGVMRVCGLLVRKKVKKVRDNNLTSTGFGKLSISGTFDILAGTD